ncbi:TPA: Arm DNA-binding domain-containing protein, partial [Streptococcus agalactiae]|nr:Arm DNA-binding domain-containing protein [Streptococcus agalactiae]
MVKDPIKKAKNGTYYFRANLGYDSKGKKIQKYRSGFTTKKEAREEYSKLLLMKPEELSENKDKMTFNHYIFEIFLPWYKTQVKLRTY